MAGTLYLNCGDPINQLPMISRGELDLRYSFCKHFSITPALALQLGTRWNMIGLTYDMVYAEYAKGETLGSIQRKDLMSCRWIYPYYGTDNFRQPYEQFANSLFKNGEDIAARKVIVRHTPASNFWHALVFLVVKGIFLIGFPAIGSIITLSILCIIGTWTFGEAYQEGWIIPVSENAMVYNQTEKSTAISFSNIKDIGVYRFMPIAQGDNTLKVVTKEIRCPRIQFASVSYSFQRLIPLIEGEQEKNFVASYSADTPWYIRLIYNVYPLLGILFVGMLIWGWHVPGKTVLKCLALI